MKKVVIIILVLGIALSYSCKKNRKVQTSINGTLITNGTNDPIKLSPELKSPRVVLFHQDGGGFQSGGNWDEIASTTVDGNSRFSFDLDLYEDDSYYLGFYDVDESKYVNINSWYYVDFYPITPGVSNNGVKVYVLAHAWVRPRFINTNPDVNNNDVFEYRGGIGGLVQHQMGPYLHGIIDSTFNNMLYKTWSGQTQYGGANHLNHEVYAKLTRNGVTIDTIIPYSVPPFDTTVVEIRY
jgi:hypothetical protein